MKPPTRPAIEPLQTFPTDWRTMQQLPFQKTRLYHPAFRKPVNNGETSPRRTFFRKLCRTVSAKGLRIEYSKVLMTQKVADVTVNMEVSCDSLVVLNAIHRAGTRMMTGITSHKLRLESPIRGRIRGNTKNCNAPLPKLIRA